MAKCPLRVLHITEGFDGGVVTFLRHVLPAQRARGAIVSLVCSPRHEQRQQNDIEYLQDRGIEVHRIRMDRSVRPWLDASALFALIRLLRHEHFDVIHTHCFKAGLLGRIAAHIVGRCSVVHTPHCFPFMRMRSQVGACVCRYIERLLSRWTDRLVHVSESQRQAAVQARIATNEPGEAILNGLPAAGASERVVCQSLRQSLGLGSSGPVVGMFCRLVHYKCPDHLVQVAGAVKKVFPDVVFLIVGDGPDRDRLERQIKRMGIEGTVRLLGHHDDALNLIALVDVCVLCSRAEGLPYVLLEAMQAGTPVVASDVPGIADLIDDGRTGLLYPWGNLDRLTGQLTRCLQDADLCRRLTRQARQHVATDHLLDVQVERMLQLYGRLAQKLEVTEGRSDGGPERTGVVLVEEPR